MKRNKKIKVLVSAIIGFFIVLGSAKTFAQPSSKRFELNVALYTNFVGSLTAVGGEYLVAEKISVYARVGTYGYAYSDWDDYEESGQGNFIGGGVRFYPITSWEKLCIGVGLEQIKGTADWEDGNTKGDVKISGISPAVTVGYKFAVDQNVVLEPNVLYVNIPSGDLKNSTIVGFGVLIGIRF